ncbi:MAG: M23 family metallopeptidase [Leptolyngbyaceae cyanobacterium bins.59]|nr:M23 family metallopeptidase [Leptolyngbyaceae cyanobacterium bins.59]
MPIAHAQVTASPCPPVLSRLTRYTVAPGDTLESIARRYNLIPATLMGFNPSLRSGRAVVGTTLVIPPYNGIRVEVAPGKTWKDLAQTYQVRADVLFEANGCASVPQTAFIPGVNWSPIAPTTPSLAPDPTGLAGYPLPALATIALGYGWQLIAGSGQVAFHSGLDLIAKVGTPVRSVGDGVVAFAGEQGAYGRMVVINHPRGRQTRYAQLQSVRVRTGQPIKSGTVLGTVGTSGQPSSTTPHLHFEVRLNSKVGWVAEDPNGYLR